MPGSGLENMPGLEDDNIDTGQFWSTDEGPTFAEFLDIINPLQHIPVVSTLYRAITGDDIGTGPRVAGGMLFGGPVGAIVAGITALFEEASGGDIGEHIADLINDITGDGDTPNVAAATSDKPEGARAGIATGIQNGANIHQAAALAGTPIASSAVVPAAAQLNRIAVNPAAAMGAVQGSDLNKTLPSAAATGILTTAANVQFPARPLATPFSAPASITSKTTGAAREPVQPASARKTIAAPQLSDAVTRSRRQQADLMLAQWAAQQMAQQKSAPGDSGQQDGNTRSGTQSAATAEVASAHPMLAPRNASPEWYAQAMDQALTKYRNGANTGPGATPAISLRR